MSSDPTNAAQVAGATGQSRETAGDASHSQQPSGRAGEQGDAHRPSEEELRAAYEAEMSRITSADMVLQATVSLLNIGGYRLGLSSSAGSGPAGSGPAGSGPAGSGPGPAGRGPAGSGPGPSGSGPAGSGPEDDAGVGARSKGPRDLEQVRDAIDGVRALLPILERRRPGELRPLRDALSQLQMAYAREARAGAAPAGTRAGAPPARSGAPGAQAPASDQRQPDERKPEPGPAESSGRLWVPGR